MENKKLRCAIYTRKSVEDGLNVEFNTLEAQREFCENYIKAQAFNGWTIIPKHYDDGGYSGKDMKRPAMQDLLKDIDDGKVDVVVVYKVDRLSRSLIDFSNFLSYIDERNISLVLVTQNIDTSTTMGRMLVNLLMTFAQYEREMSSDRIRDKMRAMKKRGMWTGGRVPYGYLCQDHRLIIDEDKASNVKFIFNKYLETGSPKLVAEEMHKITSINGGRRYWTAKRINGIIRNHMYIGEYCVAGDYFKGDYEPIISRETWDAVQSVIKIRVPYGIRDKITDGTHLLRGLIICGNCNQKMKCTYAGSRANCNYYVCKSEAAPSLYNDRCKIHTLPADIFDEVVMNTLDEELKRVEILEVLKRNLSSEQWKILEKRIESPGGLLKAMLPVERHAIVNLIVEKIVIYDNRFEIHLSKEALTGVKGGEIEVITKPLKVCKIGMRWGLYCSDETTDFTLDPSTFQALTAIWEGMKLRDDLLSGRAWSVYSLAALHKLDSKWVKQRLSLAFISPRIIVALLNHDSITTSISQLVDISPLPWPEQEKRVGLLKEAE